MTLRVSFDLEESDLKHFRLIMKQARQALELHTPESIVAAAQAMLNELDAETAPGFILERMKKLERLIQMISDVDWRLPHSETKRILNALAYFSEPEDLIPDHIPCLGFIDDAIMIELVVRELRHEIEAYEDFCAFREDLKKKRKELAETDLSPEVRLAKRRKALHERMRRRSTRRRRAGRSGRGPRLTLF